MGLVIVVAGDALRRGPAAQLEYLASRTVGGIGAFARGADEYRALERESWSDCGCLARVVR